MTISIILAALVLLLIKLKPSNGSSLKELKQRQAKRKAIRLKHPLQSRSHGLPQIDLELIEYKACNTK